MTKHVLTLAVCTGFMPNLFAQTLPRLSHSERFQWNGEPTALQATAGVLSEKPSFTNVYPRQGIMGPDDKPLMIKLVRPDTALTGNATEFLPSLGGIAVLLRNTSSHSINLAWTGEESRCQVWDAAGKELAPYPRGISAPLAPPVLLSLPPNSFLSEYHSLSSAYGVPLLMKPLQPGTYTVRCRWEVVMDEGIDLRSHKHKFNQDLHIPANELTLRIVEASKP
jgi:hypothetical protein